MSEITVREYLPQDRSAVKQCIMELQEDEYKRRPHFWASPGGGVEDILLDHLADLLEKADGKLYVGVLDGKTVGWVAVKAVTTEGPEVALKRYGYINELGVLREYQGKGVGLSLMNKAEEYIKSLGLEWMGLNTHPLNPALEFYKKLGYQEQSVRMDKKLI